MEISDDLRQKLHLISDFSRIDGENSIWIEVLLFQMEFLDDLRQKLHLISDFSHIDGENSI